ncbi:MAG TPA: DUF3142 domain-containing protein [Candidatus Binatia bacterium]|jgi:hypothetical protein|nr:DUF3142 domain-containing protein [Candidatus Binatia bacterium]
MRTANSVRTYSYVLLLSSLLAVSVLTAAGLLSWRAPHAVLMRGLPPSGNRLAGFPPVMLWAWERPEAVNFINPSEVGVAFLAKTIRLRGEKVIIRPRLQPLQIPKGTVLMAVTRIEVDRVEPPLFSSDQQAQVVSAIAALTRLSNIAALQVDFDATASERTFYWGVLYDLRSRLPDTMGLSITALASWCLYDDWLSGLPIDEAVPMLYRMGIDRKQVLFHLEAGKEFRPSLCRQSVGISTDEPRSRLPAGRRVYVFHPRPWSEEAAHDIIQEVRR